MNVSTTNGVLSAVADRRTRDLRFRQRQFISLHRWIAENVADLEDAIIADENLSREEARFVLALVLAELRRNYGSLDLKKELDIEFKVKNGRNNGGRRLPEDLVYIIPANFTLLHGVMSALCAAVAAGSCCVVEACAQLSNDLRRTSSLIPKMIDQSLDRLAYGIVTTRPDDEFLKQCLVVDQSDSIKIDIAKSLLKSQPSKGVVAIVDRTADVAVAAQAIAMSTILFTGKSPYAPSCILVNEFVEKRFSQLFDEYASTATRRALNGVSIGTNAEKKKELNGGLHKDLGVTRRSGALTLIQREAWDITRTQEPLAPLLLPTSSLDDAIDLLQSRCRSPLLASFIFGDRKASKYLAQFIRAEVSFINHIPASILVGPAAPSGHPVSSTAKFCREMMEIPSPQFCTSESIAVDEFSNKEFTAASQLLEDALQPLKPTGQGREGDLNFFVQSLRASFTLFIYLPLTIAGAVLVGYGGRSAYRRWR